MFKIVYSFSSISIYFNFFWISSWISWIFSWISWIFWISWNGQISFWIFWNCPFSFWISCTFYQTLYIIFPLPKYKEKHLKVSLMYLKENLNLKTTNYLTKLWFYYINGNFCRTLAIMSNMKKFWPVKIWLYPVDLHLISKISIWKNQVWRTWFLVYFKLDFYCLGRLQKSISKMIFAG